MSTRRRKTKIYAIPEVAAQFNRLFAHDPELVDATEISWGHGTEAGYIGHERTDEPSVVGWYCQGGDVGHPIMSVANDDLQLAGEVLAGMEAAKSLGDVERALTAAGVRFARLV